MNLAERKQLFRDTLAFNNKGCVPSLCNAWSYKIYDAGYTLQEALFDYDVMEKVVRQFHERYHFDTYFDLGTRNPMQISKALGSFRHRIDEKADAIVIEDYSLMQPEEYPEFTADQQAFNWSKALQRLNPDLTYGQLQATIGAMLGFFGFNGKIQQIMVQEYNTPVLYNAVLQVPIESLMMGVRGMRDLSLDMRRRRADVKAASDKMFEGLIAQAQAVAAGPSEDRYVFDAESVILASTIMSRKQFEEFYAPYLKPLMDTVISSGKMYYIFCENSLQNFYEFFQDFDKGSVLINLELDDIRDTRKKLPNIALGGGMPSALLGTASVEECVDFAKKLIDDMGDGFVFSSDKMLSYRNDARPETLKAVMDLVRKD
ncbi:MAG: hypothetical protein IJT62_07360 [Oscillospiraceae bacterium]|nr:hypothetical protein [Oscillospiraceae bacterium]